MRTILSISSIPAAIIVFMVSNLLFNFAVTIFNGLTTNDGGIYLFNMLDTIMTWTILYVGQSVIPVVAANYAMFAILDGEQRYWLSTFLKILFAAIGVLLFSSALTLRIITEIELDKYLTAYILSIASFVAVPIYMSDSK